jgi:hypothetical protein
MIRTTAVISVVAALAFAGCGGDDDDATPAAKGGAAATQETAVTPAGGKSAEAEKGGKAAAKKSAEALTPAEKAKAQAATEVAKKQDAAEKEAIKRAKEAIASVKGQSGNKKITTKAQAQKIIEQAKKGGAAPLEQPKIPGAKGGSKIPAAVRAACTDQLAGVKGALASSTKAQQLPGALSSAIKSIEKLTAPNSSVQSGTQQDYVARNQAMETAMAMRRALVPAKKYAASGSSSDRAKLNTALKTLRNTAQIDRLPHCAV